MAAGCYGIVQSAKLYGEQEEIHRLRYRSGIGIVEILQLAVESHALPAVALHPAAVCQYQHMVPSQCFGQKVGVQGAQSAQTDDTCGFNIVHAFSPHGKKAAHMRRFLQSFYTRTSHFRS